MKALQKIEGFVLISKGMLALLCLFVSGWTLLRQTSILVSNIKALIDRFFFSISSGKHIRTVFSVMVFLVICGMSVNAQQNYFRVLDGIPHLPVFANGIEATSIIGTPEAGMFIYSKDDVFFNVFQWL